MKRLVKRLVKMLVLLLEGGFVLLYFAYVFMLLYLLMSGIGAGSPSEADVSAAGGFFMDCAGEGDCGDFLFLLAAAAVLVFYGGVAGFAGEGGGGVVGDFFVFCGGAVFAEIGRAHV